MSQNMIGRVIKNRYQVESFIAAGGMKTVYKVIDLKRSVPLAMKFLHGELEDDPAVMRSFQRDAKAIEKLAHPNIVRFFGLEKYGNLLFLLEAYIDGPSLKEIIKEKKTLPIEEALVYLKALCAALGFSHANGVVHCDVKPANVMIDQGGNVLLTDFGIARHSDSDSTSTLAGAGTPGYMAPEQVRGDAVSPATDIYALGIVLFEMLTGQRPFQGTEPELTTAGNTLNERVRYAQVAVRPPNPRKINPKIRNEVAGVILKALEKDPGDRYSSTQEFFAAISNCAGINPESIPNRAPTPAQKYPAPPPGPLPPPPPPPSWWGRILAAMATIWSARWPVFVIGGVVVVLLAFFLARQVRFSPPPTTTITPVEAMTPAPIILTDTPGPTTTITPTPTITPTVTLTPTITPTEVPAPPMGWATDVIDAAHEVGKYSSLIVSPKGSMYDAYLDNTDDNFRMATYSGGKWRSRIIVNAGKRDGWYPKMAFDSKGALHLSYFVYDAKQVRYGGMSSSGVWSFPDIVAQTENSLVYDVEMAIDSQDIPHVIYFTGGMLYHNEKATGKWSEPETVAAGRKDSDTYLGGLDSLGIDQKDTLHLVFMSRAGSLSYMTKANGKWSTPEEIDSAGAYPSVTFDHQDNPIVSYYNPSTKALKYAYRKNQTWETITLDNQGDVGQHSSIAVDKTGNVHIAYYELTTNNEGRLKYARSHTDPTQPGNWYRYIVASNGGQWNTLVFDKNDNPIISYYDDVMQILRIAYGDLSAP
jgi:serine/threonine protein kinase